MIFVAIYHKSKHNEQLKNRRAIIRNYLRVENERYYHKRGLHWKPSRECSYLILKTSFKGENDENEIWLTGRNSLNIPTLIHQAKTFKSPRSDGGYPQNVGSPVLQKQAVWRRPNDKNGSPQTQTYNSSEKKPVMMSPVNNSQIYDPPALVEPVQSPLYQSMYQTTQVPQVASVMVPQQQKNLPDQYVNPVVRPRSVDSDYNDSPGRISPTNDRVRRRIVNQITGDDYESRNKVGTILLNRSNVVSKVKGEFSPNSGIVRTIPNDDFRSSPQRESDKIVYNRDVINVAKEFNWVAINNSQSPGRVPGIKNMPSNTIYVQKSPERQTMPVVYKRTEDLPQTYATIGSRFNQIGTQPQYNPNINKVGTVLASPIRVGSAGRTTSPFTQNGQAVRVVEVARPGINYNSFTPEQIDENVFGSNDRRR